MKNPKLEVQGPSNSYFLIQANLHYNRPRVPQFLKTFLVLYCRHLHNLEQLADLNTHARVIPGFWPRWALSWPESCVAVPATLVFGLGCLAAGPRRQENAKTRVDRRSTRDFALYQGLNPAWLFQLRCFLALVACRGAAAPGKRKNARTVTDRIMKKKNVSIYRRRLSMIEKLRTFFFSIIIFFSIILSVTVCPSIRNLNAF